MQVQRRRIVDSGSDESFDTMDSGGSSDDSSISDDVRAPGFSPLSSDAGSDTDELTDRDDLAEDLAEIGDLANDLSLDEGNSPGI